MTVSWSGQDPRMIFWYGYLLLDDWSHCCQCFCFLALPLSSSKDFSLLLIAAILALRLICPDELPTRLVLFVSPVVAFEGSCAACSKYFSLAIRTTKGRPHANLPCIFSLANLASCVLTLMVEIRNCLTNEKMKKKQTTYLFGAILNKSKATGLSAFWPPGMPQEVFWHNFPIWREHLYQGSSWEGKEGR